VVEDEELGLKAGEEEKEEEAFETSSLNRRNPSNHNQQNTLYKKIKNCKFC
jgi:hypothetical protein